MSSKLSSVGEILEKKPARTHLEGFNKPSSDKLNTDKSYVIFCGALDEMFCFWNSPKLNERTYTAWWKVVSRMIGEFTLEEIKYAMISAPYFSPVYPIQVGEFIMVLSGRYTHEEIRAASREWNPEQNKTVNEFIAVIEARRRRQNRDKGNDYSYKKEEPVSDDLDKKISDIISKYPGEKGEAIASRIRYGHELDSKLNLGEISKEEFGKAYAKLTSELLDLES